MWRWIGLLGGLCVAAAAVFWLRRPGAHPVVEFAPEAGPAVELAAVDAGPSDDEVFAASLARLEQLKHEAEAPQVTTATPSDAGIRIASAAPAVDAGVDPRLAEEIADLADRPLDEGVNLVMDLFRKKSVGRYTALRRVSELAERQAMSSDPSAAERALARLRELPTSEATVRTPLAQLAGTLAIAHNRAAHYESARALARTALELDEANPLAFLAMGELLFHENDLGAAVDTWERGLRLNPSDRLLSRRLERARAELARVGGLERLTSEHFVVSFDGRADVAAARATLAIMESAYREVGALFQQYPDGPIPLVVYPSRSYSDDHISWSAASYDGKIRLPAEGAAADSQSFRNTLFHEYAHALFHRSTHGAGAPAWLNEGLAQYAELRAGFAPAVLCQRSAHSWPLTDLQASFGSLDRHNAFYAYLEARHATERFIERFHEEGMRSLLAAMATQRSFPDAFQRALGQDYASFARAFDAELR